MNSSFIPSVFRRRLSSALVSTRCEVCDNMVDLNSISEDHGEFVCTDCSE